MKKALIKATKQYHDIEFDRLIKAGEETVVSLKRAETIISKGFAVLVETIEEEKTVNPTPKPPKPKTTRKKKK